MSPEERAKQLQNDRWVPRALMATDGTMVDPTDHVAASIRAAVEEATAAQEANRQLTATAHMTQVRNLQAAVKEAVEEEREACAKVAESGELQITGPCDLKAKLQAESLVADTARSIAAAIRGRSTPQKPDELTGDLDAIGGLGSSPE